MWTRSFASGYNATDEFSSENYINDVRPGTVYTTNNPVVDDDFYFAGNYPSGFNGLTTNRTVTVAEPDVALGTRSLPMATAPTGPFFSQRACAGAASRLRLSFELVWGGVWLSLSNTSGEGYGSTTSPRFATAPDKPLCLFQPADRDTRIIPIFRQCVAASAGPNTIEIARVGPFTANTGH